MAPPPVHRDIGAVTPSPTEPLACRVMSIALSMASIVILSIFLTRRSLSVKSWTQLPFVQWLVFSIYIDSFLFVFTTSVLKFGFGFDSGFALCDAAILLCLICYVTSKIVSYSELIYLFLAERTHIIRGGIKQRKNSKLYLFNSAGLTGLYCVVVVLNFVFRISRLENGQCVVGMKKVAMIPLIGFDTLVNVYLTMLFLIPICSVYSFQSFHNTSAKSQLRRMAIRTFIGALCTLASSITNLTVLMVLDGEPGWVCLMCCNTDILISALVIQWVTSKDNSTSAESDNIPNNPEQCDLGFQPSLAEGGSAGGSDLSASLPGAAGPRPLARLASRRASLPRPCI